MASGISRRQLAKYVVDQIEGGSSTKLVMRQLAAYLVDSRRERETELVIRTIEDVFAESGTVLACVTTATKLTDELKRAITKLIDARRVNIESVIDSTVLGGVRIETPGKLLDMTLKHKLQALSRAKV
ncbi:MAG: F0F1 ATP synthase subunit delta [Candidatus Saccharimonas sp.]